MGRTLGAKFSSRSVERFQRPQKLLFAQLQKTSACPSLVVSCPQFDVSHPRANCSGRPNSGDFLSLGDRRLQKTVMVELGHTCLSRFCQNTGPSNFTSRANKLVLRFRTTRRDHGHDHDNDNDHEHDQGHGHGEGAECTIACSDFTPRPRPDPVTCNPEGSVLNSKKSQR